MQVLDELIDFSWQAVVRSDGQRPRAHVGEVCELWAERQGIPLRYIEPGKPNQNFFVGRLNKSIRQQVLDAWLFDSLAQAQQILERSRIDCNTVRSHESHGKKTPAA